jgi:hypothetical protein
MATMLLCVFVLSVAALASAQEAPQQVFKHPLTDMPVYADDVEAVVHFPQYEETKFPLGEPVTVLCPFRNDGASMYNVSAIMGSLNSPFQFSHHYQNYSYKPFGTVVKAGEEISLKYSFTAHPELEPTDYQLAITVFYDSESETFSSTFFNETIELYYAEVDMDMETVTSLLLASLAIVVVFIGTYVVLVPESKFSATVLNKASNAAAVATGGKVASPAPVRRKKVEEEEEDDDTWEAVQSRRQKREKGDKK